MLCHKSVENLHLNFTHDVSGTQVIFSGEQKLTQ